MTVIDAMPERRREAFLLHRIENLSYPKIARRMGVSVKAVEKHISSAMVQLSRGMQADDVGP
ncbi:putative RNA polymerase sigma factor FecI [compost metagenome]